MVSYYDYEIVNNEHLYGPGKRLLIFLQGCSLHCKGCVNKHLWDFKCEKMLSKEDILRICEIEKVDGITLHGGEPLDQAEKLLEIVKALKEKKFTVILFTGYTKKEIKDYISKDNAQISDFEELTKIILEILANNPSQIEEYKNGRTNIFDYFVGQVMKQTRGKANPVMTKEILTEKLK